MNAVAVAAGYSYFTEGMRILELKHTLVTLVAMGALATFAACGANPTTSEAMPPPTTAVSERAARADSVRRSFTTADVEFMTGMIHHHAQALVMARMAPTHGASPRLKVLCKRILNGQKGEIALMQRWLRDRDQPVPDVGTGGMGMAHGGADSPHMPGMLTAEQLERLDAARGAEWDRLFLTYMIQHHRGAVVMVEELFDTYGAGQGALTFKLASGIAADQSTEIDRMQSMLYDIMFGPGGRP